MINLLGMNEKKVKVFPSDHVEETQKRFDEGWWKGFTFGTICAITGMIVGPISMVLRKKA